MPFAVRESTLAQFGNGATVAGGEKHVVQWPALRDVVMNIVGGDERQFRLVGQMFKLAQALTIEQAALQLGDGVAAVAE